MTPEEKRQLSNELDKALAMEEHHREQMLWWKRRREHLAYRLIDIHNEADDIVSTLWSDEDGTITT